jgi:hypothetical protein
MSTHRVFCSACDREVTLVPRTSETPWPMVLAPGSNVEVECLDLGVRCTGALCSFAALKPLPPQTSAPAPGAAAV